MGDETPNGTNTQEFVRFCAANNGFWKNKDFRKISNCSWISSIDECHSHYNLSSRISRHFSVFFLSEEDYVEQELQTEFNTLVSSIQNESISSTLLYVFKATISAYREVSKKITQRGSSVNKILFSVYDISNSLEKLRDVSNFSSADDISEIWLYELYHTYSARLSKRDQFVLKESLTNIYQKYFQETSDYSIFFSDIDIPTLEIFGDLKSSSIVRRTFQKLRERDIGVLRRVFADDYPLVFALPAGIKYVCRLDSNMSRVSSFTIIRTKIGNQIIKEIVGAVALLRSYSLIEYEIGIFDQAGFTYMIKDLLRSVINSETVTALFIRLSMDDSYDKIWDVLSALTDHTSIAGFWKSTNEYRDVLRKFYIWSSNSGQETHILDSQYHEIGLKLSQHIRKNLKIIVCADEEHFEIMSGQGTDILLNSRSFSTSNRVQVRCHIR